MPYNPKFTSLGGQLVTQPVGPYTKALMALLIGTTLLVSLIDRGGHALMGALAFNREAILAGQCWRLLSYPWLKPSPFGLIVASLVLYLFCGAHERMWGGPKMLRFVLTSLVGAGLLALLFGALLAHGAPFLDAPFFWGPEPAFDALLMATALRAPNSLMLFGFVLPMPTRTLVWLMVAIEVVMGIMSQQSQLSMTLAGLAMGYGLTRGTHDGALWFRTLRQKAMPRRRKPALFVVPKPRSDKSLH